MTVQPPDPSDPVADALRMRASDGDREKVANVLRDAYAEGRLSREEYDERLDEVYRAATYGDLLPVMRDLPVPPGTLAVPSSAGMTLSVPPPAPTPAGSSLTVNPALAASADTAAIAIFSGVQRRGQWTVPPDFNAVCVFGGGELDFTSAVLTSRETSINALCLFGGLEITVPDGMIVRNEAIGIFGGVELPADVIAPDAPVLVVKGAAIFGGIEIKRESQRRKRR